MFIHTLQTSALALQNWLSSVTQWCQWVEKELFQVVHASVTVCWIDESFRVSNDLHQHSLSNLLSRSRKPIREYKLLNPDLRNIKTMKHLLPVEIKATIHQEMNWGFKPFFCIGWDALKSNESQQPIFERAREKKAQKRSIKRKREILLDLA